MEFNELLKSLEAKLGGTLDLSPDSDGAVKLAIDQMAVSIVGVEELGRIILLGVVGEPPPEDGIANLYRALLEANHDYAGTSGAMLSVNPETGAVELCQTLESALLDGDGFFTEFERFVNLLETQCRFVADFRGGSARVDGAAETAARGSAPAFNDADALRI